MKQAITLVLSLALGAVAQASAWKCQIDGKIVFSDKPCAEQGKKLDTSSGQSGGFTASRQEALRAREQREQQMDGDSSASLDRGGVAQGGGRAQGPTSCPSRQEMANLRTSLSSNHLKQEQRLSAELEAAERCHRGLGQYTANDWAALRDVRADISSVDERTRQRAAAREAAVYRVADPELAAQLESRDRTRALSQRRDARANKGPEPVNCNRGGCVASDGYYTSIGGGQVTGPRGICRVVGSLMHC